MDVGLPRGCVEDFSEETFAELSSRYLNPVDSVARQLTGHPQHAEGVTQAVFLSWPKTRRQWRRR